MYFRTTYIRLVNTAFYSFLKLPESPPPVIATNSEQLQSFENPSAASHVQTIVFVFLLTLYQFHFILFLNRTFFSHLKLISRNKINKIYIYVHCVLIKHDYN